MINFEDIYAEFEDTKNVCAFCEKYSKDSVATRFLLIRSLDKNNLKDIISQHSKEEPVGTFKTLYKLAYESAVDVEQLISYIEGERPVLIDKREREL